MDQKWKNKIYKLGKSMTEFKPYNQVDPGNRDSFKPSTKD